MVTKCAEAVVLASATAVSSAVAVVALRRVRGVWTSLFESVAAEELFIRKLLIISQVRSDVRLVFARICNAYQCVQRKFRVYCPKQHSMGRTWI